MTITMLPTVGTDCALHGPAANHRPRPWQTIPLTQGYVALVSAEDYEAVASFKWFASVHKPTGNVYAERWSPGGPHVRRPISMEDVICQPPLGYVTDHINGTLLLGDDHVLDNRRNNLRVATPKENGRNRRKTGRPTSSKYKGIYWVPKRRRWHVVVVVDGVRHHIGHVADEETAARAYDAAARQYFGEFARVNFP